MQKVDEELGKLNATLDNIKDARSFDELTVCFQSLFERARQYSNNNALQVDEVAQARPEINKAVETMVQKGKWTVPGMCLIHFQCVSYSMLTRRPRLLGEVRRLEHGIG